VTSAACFSAIPIFAVIATERGGASLITILGARYLIAALGLLALGGHAAIRPLGARKLVNLVLVGGALQAIVAFLALAALKYLTAATMDFLFYTYPIWVAIIAALRGIERLTPRRVLALALAFAGIWTLVGSPLSGPLHPAGVLLTLAAALAYAFYIPFIDALQEGIGPVGTSMYVSAGAAAILLIGGVITGGLTPITTAPAWIGTLGLALISTVLAFILFLQGLAVLGPVRTAIACTAEPFFVAGLGALVLGQHATPAIGIGGAMVAIAVILIQHGKAAHPALS
jgi:drug/metabolite transporter (DMT)-like permease